MISDKEGADHGRSTSNSGHSPGRSEMTRWASSDKIADRPGRLKKFHFLPHAPQQTGCGGGPEPVNNEKAPHTGTCSVIGTSVTEFMWTSQQKNISFLAQAQLRPIGDRRSYLALKRGCRQKARPCIHHYSISKVYRPFANQRLGTEKPREWCYRPTMGDRPNRPLPLFEPVQLHNWHP
jgi:hypothetical protein